MSDLSQEAQAIINAARDADAPTAADRDRVGVALAARLGVPGLGTGAAASAGANSAPGNLTTAADAHAGTTLSASTAGGAGKGALAAKIMVGVLVIGGLGYGGYLLFGSDKERTDRSSAVLQPVAIAQEAPPAEAVPAPSTPIRTTLPAPSTAPVAADQHAPELEAEPPATEKKTTRPNGKKRVRNGAKAPAASTTQDPLASLREEKKLISKAKEVLDNGNPSLAMKVLDRHASRFANGVLAQDRAGLRVLALCDLGKIESARKEAKQFLARWPRAPMAHRVRTACASQQP